MKQAVIKTSGQQFLVSEGNQLRVDLLPKDTKKLRFEPMLVINGKDTKVGNPLVEGYKVQAEVIEPIIKAPKLKILKFKPKKRIKKLTGHRQRYSLVKITSIGK